MMVSPTENAMTDNARPQEFEVEMTPMGIQEYETVVSKDENPFLYPGEVEEKGAIDEALDSIAHTFSVCYGQLPSRYTVCCCCTCTSAVCSVCLIVLIVLVVFIAFQVAVFLFHHKDLALLLL